MTVATVISEVDRVDGSTKSIENTEVDELDIGESMSSHGLLEGARASAVQTAQESATKRVPCRQTAQTRACRDSSVISAPKARR